jgi:hypothetical protein
LSNNDIAIKCYTIHCCTELQTAIDSLKESNTYIK